MAEKETNFTLFEAEVALNALKSDFKRLESAWHEMEEKLINKFMELEAKQKEISKPTFSGLSLAEIKQLAQLQKLGMIPKDLLSRKLGYDYGKEEEKKNTNIRDNVS